MLVLGEESSEGFKRGAWRGMLCTTGVCSDRSERSR